MIIQAVFKEACKREEWLYMANEYGADQIQILGGLEAVRKKTRYVYRQYATRRTLHHLVYEIVDNSVDEALAGSVVRSM